MAAARGSVEQQASARLGWRRAATVPQQAAAEQQQRGRRAVSVCSRATARGLRGQGCPMQGA
jgi:hypothetical protein